MLLHAPAIIHHHTPTSLPEQKIFHLKITIMLHKQLNIVKFFVEKLSNGSEFTELVFTQQKIAFQLLLYIACYENKN